MTPVAWRVKDFADGWILFHTEAQALREAEPTGALIEALYAADCSASLQHELECLRAQVGQLEYPCSPHCEGYLRELALQNGGHRP